MKNFFFQKTYSVSAASFLISFGIAFGKGHYITAGVFAVIGIIVQMYCDSANYDRSI